MIDEPVLEPAPARGPGSGHRPRRPGSAARRAPAAARWPGGAQDPAGQAPRLIAAAGQVAGCPQLDQAQARSAIIAARAVYAGYHQIAVVLGPDGIPDAARIRGQAAWAAARAVHGPGASLSEQRGLRRALEYAGLLPAPTPGDGEERTARTREQGR